MNDCRAASRHASPHGGFFCLPRLRPLKSPACSCVSITLPASSLTQMAAHRKLDRRRVYPCAVVLRKRVGGSNRKWGGGSDDVFPFSSQTQSEPNLAWAFPSTGEMTLRMESRLSDFTVMIRFITSSDVMCSDLWGKEARNNSAILRACDGLSQFRTMIVKILEVVEFIDSRIRRWNVRGA